MSPKFWLYNITKDEVSINDITLLTSVHFYIINIVQLQQLWQKTMMSNTHDQIMNITPTLTPSVYKAYWAKHVLHTANAWFIQSEHLLRDKRRSGDKSLKVLRDGKCFSIIYSEKKSEEKILQGLFLTFCDCDHLQTGTYQKTEPNQTGNSKILSNHKPQHLAACCLAEFAHLT